MENKCRGREWNSILILNRKILKKTIRQIWSKMETMPKENNQETREEYTHGSGIDGPDVEPGNDRRGSSEP